MKRILSKLKKTIPYLILSVIVIFLTITLINIYGFKKRTDDYLYIKNIPYSSHIYSKRNKMDICIPNGTGDMGLVLYIHGGAWVAGSKDAYENELKSISQQGCITASMNYHYVSNKHNVFDIEDEITECLNKIYEIAKKHNINITGAILSGGSAGAHLSMLYAYSKTNESKIPIKAVYALYGPTDLTNKFYESPLSDKYYDLFSWVCGKKFTNETEYLDAYDNLQKASPIFYASTAVPTILVFGSNDIVIDRMDNINLANELINNSIPVISFEMPNSGHGLTGEGDEELEHEHYNAFINYINNYLKK